MEKRAKAIAVLILLLATSFSVLVPAVSTAASPAEYVTITLTNSQTTATQKNFSQMIKVDWSTYATDLNANVSNVRFYNSTTFSSSTELSGWIEDNNTTTATSSNVWVNLSGTIVPASGSATIYMAFLSITASWSSHWGLAPQLSTKYGEFDNGANVFSLYFNGNTATSDFTVSSTSSISQVQVTGPTGTTINALKYSEDQCSAIGLVYSLKSLQSGDYIGETSFSSGGGGDIGVVGLGTSSSATTSQYMFSADTQFGGEYLSWAWNDEGTNNGGPIGGTSTTAWHYEWFSYTPGTSTASICAAPQLYSTSDGYSGTVNNYIPSSDPVYVSAASNGNSYLYYNWLRIRDTPPDGIMPSVSFGSVSTVTTIGYHISFQQTSLPSGTKWGIRLNDTSNIYWLNTASQYDNFTGLTSGTYTYNVVNATGYSSNPYSGLLTISSTNPTQNISFIGYAVTFNESGLPAGTTFYVNISKQPGLSESQTGQHITTTTSITAHEPNGTYTYTFQSANKDYSGGSGEFTMNGNAVNINIHFSAVLYYLNFTPDHKPKTVEWGVNVSGVIQTGYANLSFQLTNGTYYWNASAINGSFNNPIGWWRLTNKSGTILLHNDSAFSGMKIVINGASYTNDITFTRAYNITFKENGITSGTWEVSLTNAFGTTLYKELNDPHTQDEIQFQSTEGNYTNGSYDGSLSLTVYGVNETRFVNSTGTNTFTINITGNNIIVTYNFTTQYYLKVYSNPSAGGSASPESGYFNASQTIYLTANPNASFEFLGFVGTGFGSYTGIGYYSVNQYVAQIKMLGAITEEVEFGEYTTLTFHMQGITTSTKWGVEISDENGMVQWDNGTGYFIIFDIPDGTYYYQVTNIKSLPQSGTITVSGPTEIGLQSVNITYDVRFIENGLNGIQWKVNVFSNQISVSSESSTNTISLSLPNDTYSYTVQPVNGYIANNSTGKFTVYGSALIIYINFTEGNPFILQGIKDFVVMTLRTSNFTIPEGTQVPINIDWSEYSQYVNPNLSNVIFMNSTFYPLYAWIETNASFTAQSSTVWIKLNQQINANSNMSIYIAFQSKNRNNFNKYGYLGEASQYSQPFGKYNNIAMVMDPGLAIQIYTYPNTLNYFAINSNSEKILYNASMLGGTNFTLSVALSATTFTNWTFTAMPNPIHSAVQGTPQNVPYTELTQNRQFDLSQQNNVELNFYLSSIYVPGTFPSPPLNYSDGNVFYGKAIGFVNLNQSSTIFHSYVDDGQALGLSPYGSYNNWLSDYQNQSNVINSFEQGQGRDVIGTTNLQGTYRISSLYEQLLYYYAFWNFWTNYNVQYYSPTFVSGINSLEKNITMSNVASSYNSFYEYGLPAGMNWSISISGNGISKIYTTNSNVIYTYLPQGVYDYTVGSMVNDSYHSGIDGKFVPSPATGHVIVTSTFTVQVIIFSINQVLEYNLEPEQASGSNDNITLPILAVNIHGLPAGNKTISEIIEHLTAKFISKDQNQTENLTWSLSSSRYGMIVIFLHIGKSQIKQILEGTAVISFVAAFQLGTVSEIAAGVAGPEVFSSINTSAPPPGLNFSSPSGFINSLNAPLSDVFGQGPVFTHMLEVATIVITAIAAYYLDRIRKLHEEADRHVAAIKKKRRSA